MFKRGDKVKRTYGKDHPHHNLYLNNIYTVEKCMDNSIWLKECSSHFEPNYFKLVNEDSNYEIY